MISTDVFVDLLVSAEYCGDDDEGGMVVVGGGIWPTESWSFVVLLATTGSSSDAASLVHCMVQALSVVKPPILEVGCANAWASACGVEASSASCEVSGHKKEDTSSTGLTVAF
jgi:hypothetical protein